MVSPLKDLEQVLQYMDDYMTTTEFRGEKQTFLPKPSFDAVTAKNVIRQLVSKDEDLYLEQQEEDDFVERIALEGRKIFATCIFSDTPLSCVRALFDDGLTDAKFPFEEADCPRLKGKRKFRNNFIPNQKRFNPAFFEMDSELEWDDRVAKPVQFDERSTSLLGQGTFGNVYKIWIHPSQRSFSSGSSDEDLFAMKVTQHEGTREVSFHRAMANLPPHDHLLRCLASFTFSSQYHMLYEKAESDVEKFMANNPDPQASSGMKFTDLAQQLFGLASALAIIHNQGRVSNSNAVSLLSVPALEAHKTGYIHDIKPENLLVFVYKHQGIKKYWFRLSDFSCAKVADSLISGGGKNRNSWKTVSKSGTPVYRAPEATGNGKTSRPYDLWSLGCVYLELLVWFLEGYPSLEQFRDDRECHVSPDGREDEGFYYKRNDHEDFRLREVVLQKIESVRGQCEGPLKEIANMIPKLLQIVPQQRPTAEKLLKDLEHIDNGTKPPVTVGSITQTLPTGRGPIIVPTYVSDPDSDSNTPGGPLIKVQCSTDS